MGFLFQNCSGGGGGSGTGSGEGSASGPPPEISVDAFPGTTAAELTITEQSHLDGLEVSGKCDSKEHGQEIRVKAVGDDEDNPVVKTTECNAPDWSVILSRDDLNDLQGANMKALFTASIQSKTGVTGTSQPQALFVEPIIQPPADQDYTILLEDIFEIKGVCRLVVVGNIYKGTLLLFSYVWFKSPQIQLARLTSNNGTLSVVEVEQSLYDTLDVPESVSTQPFTNTLTVTIPRGSTEPKRYGLGASGEFAPTENAYSYCKATTP